MYLFYHTFVWQRVLHHTNVHSYVASYVAMYGKIAILKFYNMTNLTSKLGENVQGYGLDSYMYSTCIDGEQLAR